MNRSFNKLFTCCAVALMLMAQLFPAKLLAKEQPGTPAKRGNTNEVLQLEATIRGDKQQPQVLSIVPWQIPGHRVIEQTTLVEQSKPVFEVIERGRFLRRLSMTKDLNGASDKLSDEQDK